ncbi:unnamed protein product [Diplocarpon coronariae]
MGPFGSTSLANKFGIILGSLIVLIFLAGFIKLQLNKRRLTQQIKKAALEIAGKTDEETFVGKKIDEGDLFGVRALEYGYFGGVSQTRSSSSTPLYVLSPSTTVVDWEETGHLTNSSASSSVLGNAQSPAPSTNLYTTRDPSPQRLEPSDAERDAGGPKLDASIAGGKGGSYMPPLPSPGSLKYTSTTNSSFEEGQTPAWIFPLDVQLGRNSTARSRPVSYLPNVELTGEIEKARLAVPSRPPRGSPKSAFPPGDDGSRPSSRMSPIITDFTPKKLPLDHLAPYMTIVDPSNFPFPQDTRNWNPNSLVSGTSKQSQLDISPPAFSEVIYSDNKIPPGSSISMLSESIVSKQGAWITRPGDFREISPDALKSLNRHNVVGSNMYSTRNPILEYHKDNSTAQSRARQRSRSRSTAHKRNKSSISLARTQDSLRRHSRKLSHDAKRRSRDRDAIYYDLALSNRTRAGSVQSRTAELGQARESPFSDAYVIQHSHDTSVCSSSSRKSSSISDREERPPLPVYPRNS